MQASSLYTGTIGDWLVVRMARRSQGIMEPESRLWLFSLSLVLMPAGLILLGRGSRTWHSLVRSCLCHGSHSDHQQSRRSELPKLLHRLVTGVESGGCRDCHPDPEYHEFCDRIRVSGAQLSSLLRILAYECLPVSLLGYRTWGSTMRSSWQPLPGLRKRFCP